MILRLETLSGVRHYSIRDIYTNNEGALIVRLENQDGRAWIEFPADELRPLIEGLKDNQRFRPPVESSNDNRKI